MAAKRPNKHPTKPRKTVPASHRWLAPLLKLVVLRVSLIALVGAVGYVAWLDLLVKSRFAGKRWDVPARIYARPLEIYPGLVLTQTQLLAELALAGYQQRDNGQRAGTFLRSGNVTIINTRAFDYWDGTEPSRRLTLTLANGTLTGLSEGGAKVALARLDPSLIGRIYPRHQQDRVLVKTGDTPRLLLEALLAVEDRQFFSHAGVSLTGIARAAWVNLRSLDAVQGGSTLTQQLAKNFFLSQERSLSRKLNEAVIALLLEAHFTKQDILEAYLNEVYLGQDGRRAIHGFGLASEFYFSRPLRELQLHESALLVSLVRGASYYNPRRHPQRALQRRNRVLASMSELGLISVDEVSRAQQQALGVVADIPKGNSRFPAFLDLVHRQLKRDYHDQDLTGDGLRVFTTLDPTVQLASETALAETLQQVERSKGLDRNKLDGAVVVVSPQSGEVVAVVGGRDPRQQGFNRALDAIRPVGSLIKPAVYLTALDSAKNYTLTTLLADRPVRIPQVDGSSWEPGNYDGKMHGEVPLFVALSHSYNLATVNLGMDIGVSEVRKTLSKLGVKRPVPGYPSLLLGAVSLSPLDVAAMYQTIANDGFTSQLRAIREVTDAGGRTLTRYDVVVSQAFKPQAVYLLNRALQEVMWRGTGRGVRSWIEPNIVLAGKTGTTDELRDSWFAGFDARHLAIVWVGRDDNSPAGLSGSSGALKVWGSLYRRIGVRSISTPVPEGLLWEWVEPVLGSASHADCPDAVRLPFVQGTEPTGEGCHGTALINTNGNFLRTIPRFKDSNG